MTARKSPASSKKSSTPVKKAVAKTVAKVPAKARASKPTVAPAGITEKPLVKIPLNLLSLSPKNVRTGPRKRIPELAANIAAQGLIQNLSVEELVDSTGKHTGDYAVTAGGRRLEALLLLCREGKIRADHLIDCRVYAPGEAIEVSTSENTQHEQMHPADEYVAFAKMSAAGRSPEDIGARFGVSAAVVTQRLKLGNVAPELMAEFREDEVRLDQLMAMAITDDHARQMRVWNRVKSDAYRASPANLRSALTEGEIEGTDAIARFVGVEAYESAGGVVRRDLFVDGAKGLYFPDSELIERLAAEKLAALVPQVEAEGWQWVEVRPDMTHADWSAFAHIEPTEQRDWTQAEAKQAKTLGDERDKLLAVQHDENTSDDDYEAADERCDAIRAELKTLEARRMIYSAESMQQAGAIITMTEHGTANITRGLVRHADTRTAATGATSAGSAAGATSKAKGAGKTSGGAPAVSDALCAALTAQKTLAMQALMLDRPDVALIATVHNLLVTTVYTTPWACAGVEIRSSQGGFSPGGADPEARGSKAGQVIDGRLSAVRAELPDDAEYLFGWLLDKDQTTLLALLALCVARNVNAVQQSVVSSSKLASHLSVALNLNMADWWEPTATNYLNRVSRDQVAAAVAEAYDAKEAASLPAKKADAVERAADLLAGKRWLPAILK